jgi:hypothetical protein
MGEAMNENAKFEIEYVEENSVAAEVEAADPGPLAQTDLEQRLHKRLCVWASRKAKLDTLKKQCAAMIRRAEADLEDWERMYRTECAAMTQTLLAGGKRKSLITPYATVGFRTSPQRLFVSDPEALLLAWRDGMIPDDCVRVRHEASLSGCQKVFKECGEIPSGCDVDPEREVFFVREQ